MRDYLLSQYFIGLFLFLFIQSGIRTTVRTFNHSALCLFLVAPTIFSALRVIEFEGIFRHSDGILFT